MVGAMVPSERVADELPGLVEWVQDRSCEEFDAIINFAKDMMKPCLEFTRYS